MPKSLSMARRSVLEIVTSPLSIRFTFDSDHSSRLATSAWVSAFAARVFRSSRRRRRREATGGVGA
jgi:hypothetical protein